MEGLSLVANIIPIITTAAKVVKTLEKVAKLRHAPPALLQLLNEVSDFRVVIATVQETVQQLQEQDLSLIQHFNALIANAAQILDEIDEISKDHLTRHLEEQSLDSLFQVWKVWLKKHGNLQELSKRMQQVRVNITNALILLTASEIPRLRNSLRDITLSYHEISNDVNTLSTNLSTLRPSIDVLQDMLQRIHSVPFPSPAHPLLRSLRLPPEDVPRTQGAMFRIQTTVKRDCNSLCICRCHQSTRIASPTWMKGLVGLLFVTYNASPLLGYYPCSEKLCCRHDRNNKLLTVNYYFPAWLVSRMISFRDKFTPRDGHSISVRTPRVVEDHRFTVYIRDNQLFQLQMMFARYKASPFDVDENGMSLLAKAVSLQRVDIVRFLLNEHADPHLEDQFSQSPIDYMFHQVLTAPDDPNINAIYRMLLPFIDVDEIIIRQGFNPIHQIVVGLRPSLQLEKLLSASTVGIDAKDGRKWTPLFWAVRLSNIGAINTLLNYGALIDTYDLKDRNIFHVVMRATKERICILKLLLNVSTNDNSSKQLGNSISNSNIETSRNSQVSKLINYQSHDSLTPLTLAASLHNYDESHLLLAHNASPNIGYPLFASIQNNAHSITELLLSHGITTNIRDCGGMAILHSAACLGDLKTLSILRDWVLEARSGSGGESEMEDESEMARGRVKLGLELNGEEVDKWRRTARECFETVRVGLMKEEIEERRECKRVFLQLLDRLAMMANERREVGNGEVIYGGFEEVDEEIGDGDGDGDENEEVFYDVVNE